MSRAPSLHRTRRLTSRIHYQALSRAVIDICSRPYCVYRFRSQARKRSGIFPLRWFLIYFIPLLSRRVWHCTLMCSEARMIIIGEQLAVGLYFVVLSKAPGRSLRSKPWHWLFVRQSRETGGNDVPSTKGCALEISQKLRRKTSKFCE